MSERTKSCYVLANYGWLLSFKSLKVPYFSFMTVEYHWNGYFMGVNISLMILNAKHILEGEPKFVFMLDSKFLYILKKHKKRFGINLSKIGLLTAPIEGSKMWKCQVSTKMCKNTKFWHFSKNLKNVDNYPFSDLHS